MAPPDPPALDLDAVFRSERRRLWTLCYRLSGSAAEADDLVQDAFVRAIERPPPDTSRGLGPWLVRLATNLALEELRRRKGQEYGGEWLPSPIDTENGVGFAPGVDATPVPEPEGRYGLAESTSFAFLIALEALDPTQRAVLILRDVLDYSARATSDVIETTEENVRVLYDRAREAMEAYDATRTVPTTEARDTTRKVLDRFLDCLARQDGNGLEELLADDVCAVTDSGGTYTARREPTTGRAEVARIYLQAAKLREEAGLSTEVRLVNGLPAALLQLERPQPNEAPRAVIRFDLDEAGRIRHLHSILAPSKLATIRFARD